MSPQAEMVPSYACPSRMSGPPIPIQGGHRRGIANLVLAPLTLAMVERAFAWAAVHGVSLLHGSAQPLPLRARARAALLAQKAPCSFAP